MKAMQISHYGGTDGLNYVEVPAPEPGPDQITLDVDYAGASYVEALFAEGFGAHSLPWVPGIEASGRVRAVGAEVDEFTPGQPVAALTINGGGGFGQVAVTRAALAVPLPLGMDPARAAVVPTNTTTALVAMERIARLQPGEAVLVHAAAGGLGSQLGQVAHLMGASRVVGVVGRESKRQAALDLGYDEVWLRTDLENATHAQFDVIADPVSGPGRQTSIELLRLGGRLLAVGDASQEGDQYVNSNTLWFTGTSVQGLNLGALAAAHPRLVGSYLRRALALVASGEVRVEISEHAPIQEAPRVLAALRSGSTVGKVVLRHEEH